MLQAGTAAATKLHAVALVPGVAADDVGARLMDAVAEAARKTGAGFLLAEMPEQPFDEKGLTQFLRRHPRITHGIGHHVRLVEAEAGAESSGARMLIGATFQPS